MVRPRVSSEVMRASLIDSVSRAQRSTKWCAADPGPRFHCGSKNKQPGSRICDAPLRAASRAGHGGPPSPRTLSALVLDRHLHVLDLQFAHQLRNAPGDTRIGLDLEVIH